MAEKRMMDFDMVDRALDKMMPDKTIDPDEKVKQMLEW